MLPFVLVLVVAGGDDQAGLDDQAKPAVLHFFFQQHPHFFLLRCYVFSSLLFLAGGLGSRIGLEELLSVDHLPGSVDHSCCMVPCWSSSRPT